ncbi:MAG: alkaline phosphatase D family protein [Promethearchaeota archaeon]
MNDEMEKEKLKATRLELKNKRKLSLLLRISLSIIWISLWIYFFVFLSIFFGWEALYFFELILMEINNWFFIIITLVIILIIIGIVEFVVIFVELAKHLYGFYIKSRKDFRNDIKGNDKIKSKNNNFEKKKRKNSLSITATFEKIKNNILKKKERKQFIHIIFILAIILINPEISSSAYQYKKITRDQISLLVNDHPSIVYSFTKSYLKANPEDDEIQFIQVLALSQLNRIEEAADIAIDMINQGFPIGRFLAGPRNLIKYMVQSKKFQDFLAIYGFENYGIVHGPFLGNLSSNGVIIWLRAYNESFIKIRYSEDPDFSSYNETSEQFSTESEDFVLKFSLWGLNSSTTYYYKILLEDNFQWIAYKSDKVFNFTTFPDYSVLKHFAIGFGGGAGYNPENERIWRTIKNQNVNLFLFLGDNVYIDTPEILETQKYTYYRRQSQPFYAELFSSIPMYAIWDDHDFGENDQTSSIDPDVPWWKKLVLNIFEQNFPNPSFGGGYANPGVWFSFNIGDVEFFMLDCRYYRQDPDEFEHPTMLGSYQLNWLKNALESSNATFKVIASSVPWASGTKPSAGSKDTWDGFPEEREEIFSFIEDHKIDGVILLSADRHRSDAWKISRTNGYDLYEFESSKLTNVHTHAEMSEALFSYNKKNSFGKIDFYLNSSESYISYSIINIDGECVYKLNVTLSEISFSS